MPRVEPLARFRVGTSHTGIRRNIDVFVLKDQYELSHFAYDMARGRKVNYKLTAGLFWHPGYAWPKPEGSWFGYILMHQGDLTTRVIAHESTHAAMEMYYADCVTKKKLKKKSFVRKTFNGTNETIAYIVGDLSAAIVKQLYNRGLFPKEEEK